MTLFHTPRNTQRGPVQVRWAPVRVSLAAVVTVWLARQSARLTVALFRTPALLLALVAVAGLVVLGLLVGWWAVVALVAVAAVLLIVWRVRWPAGFEHLVTDRFRAGWRWLWCFRRGWQPAMVTAGLAQSRDGREHLPELLNVRSSRWVDRVPVRLLPGQTLADWASVADRLASSFDVADCRIHSTGRVQVIELWALRRDPLVDVVEPALRRPGPAVDLQALPVGRVEDGQPFRLGVLGSHLLVVGATGAGKGSVVWSILDQLTPAIAQGRVVLWVIDPKGGMELAPGQPLFARFAYGDDHGQGWEASFAEILEDAVTLMRHRQARLRGVTRLHTPTPADPLVLVVVDELASLTSYVTDRTARKRIDAALSLLLSQGRAVGVSVLAAVQDPRKETVPIRDLFPTRICLRVTEPEQVTLALGAGARARGALADQISDGLPGVGYVLVEGQPEPARVRFAHITDHHITDLVESLASVDDAVALPRVVA